jgi:hypothetical protein
MKHNKLFVMECIPKIDDCREGQVLFDFLNMTLVVTNRGEVLEKDFSSKNEFLSYLRRKPNIKGCNFIHLSGHGDPDSRSFQLPAGDVHPEDFPKSCFKGRTVTFSACSLSRNDFMNDFLERTEAEAVIVPMNDVAFDDAAIWYAYFYYLVLHHGFTAEGAWNRSRRLLCEAPGKGQVRGGFQYWS